MITLTGLTWDHPRATEPLHAAAVPLKVAFPHLDVQWTAQPLAGFESRLIEQSFAAYDLVVFDHPHVGEIAAGELALPFNNTGHDNADYVGPSLASYRMDGRLWGLPIDAAAQVGCARSDLLAGLDLETPHDWAGVVETGERVVANGQYLAIAFGGVHALMVFLTLCANQGAHLGSGGGDRAYADRAEATEALALMRRLLDFCPPPVIEWNSIAAQDAMVARDDLVVCPVVFGFSPYARPGNPKPLTYFNLPGPRGHAGSTIGGAGLAVSARTRHPELAASVAVFLARADVQTTVIAGNGGQPAAAAAWGDAVVNRAAKGFYAATRSTLEAAWVRPRFFGYMDFQRAGSAILGAWLRGELTSGATLDAVDAAWRTARAHAA